MKKSRCSDNRIHRILKQAEAGTPVPELCREHNRGSAIFCMWRAEYGGMEARENLACLYDFCDQCNVLPLPGKAFR